MKNGWGWYVTIIVSASGCGGIVSGAFTDAGIDRPNAPTYDAGGYDGTAPSADASIVDAQPPSPARCDPNKPFGPLTALVPPFAAAARLSLDELSIYVSISGPPGWGQIASATRASTAVPFPQIMTVGFWSPSQSRTFASVTADGLTMVYYDMMVGPGTYVATRPGPIGAFTAVAPIPNIADTSLSYPYLVPDGSALWISTGTPKRIGRATRSGNTWLAPVAVPGLDQAGAYLDVAPVVTPDERTIFFASGRPGSALLDIWTATRPSANAPFGLAARVIELDTADYDLPSWISPDGCVMYLTRTHAVDGGAPVPMGFMTTRPL